MPTSTNVTNLKINTLTKAQYDTAVQGGVIGPNELSVITDLDESIQVDTMPAASASEVGKIYQFVGTTDVNYTNGYFYKCVSDGQTPATYSWEQTDVMPAGSSLPDQTGQSGKFLTTDGSSASWAEALTNKATGNEALAVKGAASGTRSVAVKGDAYCDESVVVGVYANAYRNTGSGKNVLIGKDTEMLRAANSIAIGQGARVSSSAATLVEHAIQLGSTGSYTYNNDSNTFKVANGNGNFEMMSADGTIPTDRLVHAINKYSTMPTAASTNEGWIVQFTGTTDSTYTHGHLYECVSDGQTPATYSWSEVSLGGGGSSYTAGTGIDITSGVIRVTSPTLQNVTTNNGSLAIVGTVGDTYTTSVGVGAQANGNSSTALGESAKANGEDSVAIGRSSYVSPSGANGRRSVAVGYGAVASGGRYCIQLGTGTNNEAGTFCVGLGQNMTEYNYKMLDSDGTIPTARLTKVNTTVTLAAADWSNGSQTVTVSGVTSSSIVWVSPDPTDQSAYVSAGILCTAQGTDSLTFTATTTPSADIDVVVVAM